MTCVNQILMVMGPSGFAELSWTLLISVVSKQCVCVWQRQPVQWYGILYYIVIIIFFHLIRSILFIQQRPRARASYIYTNTNTKKYTYMHNSLVAHHVRPLTITCYTKQKPYIYTHGVGRAANCWLSFPQVFFFFFSHRSLNIPTSDFDFDIIHCVSYINIVSTCCKNCE